jgi:hypothetical protein
MALAMPLGVDLYERRGERKVVNRDDGRRYRFHAGAAGNTQ